VSLDQFIGACLGLVLIMLARLLDRWLPATEGGTERRYTRRAPSSTDLDVLDEPPPDEPGG